MRLSLLYGIFVNLFFDWGKNRHYETSYQTLVELLQTAHQCTNPQYSAYAAHVDFLSPTLFPGKWTDARVLVDCLSIKVLQPKN